GPETPPFPWPSFPPPRLEPDSDLYGVADHLRPRDRLVPGDSEIPPIHGARGLERDPLVAFGVLRDTPILPGQCDRLRVPLDREDTVHGQSAVGHHEPG